MVSEKVKAFVAHIVEECEQEGLTLSDALSVPQALRWALNARATEIYEHIDVKGFRVDP